jgi:alanyl-tRNA synthetase
MDSRTIRETFFAFFAERGHARVPSSSLVPNDPTLLLTNAGMNQFKPYFTGEQTPPFVRAMSVQKCMRAGGKHNDIDEVGKTGRHLTFFEMLGNFSFGDYYKQDACLWAWELVTEVWGLDPARLWVSIYDADDEAHEAWVEGVGVRSERVVRRGKSDNFWSMGVAGPCGPSSEIFVDLGAASGPSSDRGPADNEDRYVEVWNLVFMQNDCNSDIEIVAELPHKNIDTGAGLERLAGVLQGVDSVFETDLLAAMVQRAADLTTTRYGVDERADVALRILADHGRALTFMVADGVLPSNEERGYVLRRIMRRAVRQARLLGVERSVLPGLVHACVELMAAAYPELVQRRDFIAEVASREEERFSATLRQGLVLLERAISEARSGTLAGDMAFRLHDTFGFPIDLTTEIAQEAGLEVDDDGFRRLMAEQRQRARAARSSPADAAQAEFLLSLAGQRGDTDFLGYEHLECSATVRALSDGLRGVPAASEGDELDLLLDRTVFYAEGGGQVGDRGVIAGRSGTARVLDTRRIAPGLTGHRVRITAGEIAVGDEVVARVDAAWRSGAERAHTATHILHWVLRDRLGEHATQAGSLVEPGRLRFDFNHFEAVGEGRLAAISSELQERVLNDDSVRAYETSFDYARSIGAMAIFGEKYGDFVRVVEVGDYSKELCGGTHVPHTSTIGVVVINGEQSVGANLRRVEALVGKEGLDWLKHRAELLERAAASLKTAPEEVAERVERLLSDHRDMAKRLEAIELQAAEVDAGRLADAAMDVDGTRLVVARRDVDVDALRALAQRLKGRLGSGVVVLGAAGTGRANLVGAVTKDLAERGLSATELLAPGTALLGGGGGGKPELAISGGPKAEALEQAIEAVASAARAALRR